MNNPGNASLPIKIYFYLLSCFIGLFIVPGYASSPPPVPTQYQALYSTLNTLITSFNATLGNPAKYPFLNAGALKSADGNNGPNLLNAMPGIELQALELKALGVKAIEIELGFPMLYKPFLDSQGQSYSAFVSFYQQLASYIRSLGLKLIVENNCLLASDIATNWDVAPFYASLNWTQYQQARAQTALTIAQVPNPDYLVVMQEQTTEATNSGQSNIATPEGATAMLAQILASVQQSGVLGMKVGAGTISSQKDYLSYVQSFVTQPVDFIDMPIYPIENNFLQHALDIASTAAAAGKPLSMTECWMNKVSEIHTYTPDQIRSLGTFSFWAPLDAYFIQTMQKLANSTKMLFLTPYNTEYYTAYLPYNNSTKNLSTSELVSQENAQASANAEAVSYTSTGMSYYASLVSPPDYTPPHTPTHLAPVSGNPDTAYMTWNDSTDNVGVAGYNILRNGLRVATQQQTSFKDSGLTQGTTYNYSVEAVDLAGNVSPASAPVPVTTRETTPPPAPKNVAATPDSKAEISVTWSASTDNVGVKWYKVFRGTTSNNLSQVVETQNLYYNCYHLTASTKYYFAVEAVDSQGNASAMSTIVAATTLP